MSTFQPGELIGGRYRLIRIIGSGAMGTVWSARNESTDRDFALKLMLPDAAKNPLALQRFFQEAKASGRLRHRCIVEVYDLGRIEPSPQRPNDPHIGTPYLVMELLEGEPLDSVLRRKKTLPIGTALRLVRDLARALDVAHKQRIVHRDLKPANVYLHRTLEGTIVPKILDFGISKLVGPTNFDAVATSVGTVLGSPAYMSPEQAAGETDVDARSDVWSLGVILYKTLCGTVPFSAANYNALMMAINRTAHPPLVERVDGLPIEIDALIDKCLAKDRNERFDSARTLAEEIDKIIAAHPALAQIDLEALVNAPVELPADEARTIAVEASQGTLAATELGDGPPRPSQRVPAGAPGLANAPSVDVALPAFRPQLSKRVRVAAGIAGIVALLVVVFFARRDREAPTAASPAQTPAALPSFTAASAPAPTTAPTTTPGPAASPAETTEPVPASAAPSPSVSAPAPTVVATASPAATAHKQTKAPATKSGGAAKTASTAKSVHEGVTAAGF